MLRSNTVAITDFMRGTTARPGAQIKRGYIAVDFSELSSVIDGNMVGTVACLRVVRKASLNDGEIQYYGPDGVLIAQNF